MKTGQHRTVVTWIAAALFLLLAAGCAKQASRSDIAATLREDPNLVLDVLRENPEELERILVAAAAAREARRREARFREELVNPLVPAPAGGRPVLGEAGAPVLLVAYSDFLCRYCASAARTVHALFDRRPGQVRFVYKHLPHSRLAAELALYFEALGRQDPSLAWRFHDEVFARQEDLAKDEAVLARILEELAPDRDRLERDLQDPELRQHLADDTGEADRFGFDGAPSFVLGGVSMVGSLPLARFEEVLDLVRKGPAAAPSGEWAPSGEATCADCLQ
ncbi:MAG: DsbA family protein [Thermodesulfobacteriota bacterium]